MARSEAITRRQTSAMAIAGVGLVGALSLVAAPGPEAQTIPEMPAVTINSTTLRVGEQISFSGTGCVDADTGTGDGLEVVLFVPADAGRGGTTYRPIARGPADTDGSFEGTGVVDQPSFPHGEQTGFYSCQGIIGESIPSVHAQRSVRLTIEPPALPDLSVTAGSTVDYVLPCSIEGGEYGSFSIYGSSEGLGGFHLSVPGSYPYETSPQQGDQVQIQVPADAAPGVYDASASCSISQAGTSAYFTGFTITVEAGVVTEPPADPAPPADPTPAVPTYTG